MSKQESVKDSRRRLIKAVAGSGSIIAGATIVSKKWAKPVVDSVILPAHAQTTPPSIYNYFEIFFTTAGGGSGGPAAVSVVVDSGTGIASVEAVNRFINVLVQIQLNIDGTPSSSFTGTIDGSCGGVALPSGSSWAVVSYTLGDPNIVIESTGGGSTWSVTVPMGTGTLPALCSG